MWQLIRVMETQFILQSASEVGKRVTVKAGSIHQQMRERIGHFLRWNTALRTVDFISGSLIIDPRNADDLYVSTEDRELFGSFDGGQTWQILMEEAC